jgi:hypothetical protein
MRSEYVFAATKKISCRFLLCRVASVSARRLHTGSTHASATINESLRLIAAAALAEDKGIVRGDLQSHSGGRLPSETRTPTRTGIGRMTEPQLEPVPAV